MSAYYYLGLGLAVFARPEETFRPGPPWARAAVVAAGVLLLALGLLPGLVLPALAAGVKITP